MNASEYFRRWKLGDVRKVSSTKTSDIYRATFENHPAILKVLTDVGKKFEASSSIALEVFDGVGSVRLFKADGGALLMEDAGETELKSIFLRDGDGAATEIACDVILKVHNNAPSSSPPNVISLERHFRALFALAAGSSSDSIFVDAAKVACQLLATEKDKVLLHGDIHHRNILESERGWLAIDPQPVWGERTYEVANLFFNPDDSPSVVEQSARIKSLVDIFSSRLRLDPKRVLDFAFTFGGLSAAWCEEDGLDPSRRLRLANLLRHLRVSF